MIGHWAIIKVRGKNIIEYIHFEILKLDLQISLIENYPDL